MSDKFPRQNWFRAKKLGTAWRRLKGGTSKMRKCNIGRTARPKLGYGSPKAEKYAVNGEHAVVVSCLKDLENCKTIDKITGHQNKSAILSSRIGLRLALEMSKEADKKGIKILNRRKIIKAEKILLRKKRAKEALKKKSEEHKKEDIQESKPTEQIVDKIDDKNTEVKRTNETPAKTESKKITKPKKKETSESSEQ